MSEELHNYRGLVPQYIDLEEQALHWGHIVEADYKIDMPDLVRGLPQDNEGITLDITSEVGWRLLDRPTDRDVAHTRRAFHVARATGDMLLGGMDGLDSIGFWAFHDGLSKMQLEGRSFTYLSRRPALTALVNTALKQLNPPEQTRSACQTMAGVTLRYLQESYNYRERQIRRQNIRAADDAALAMGMHRELTDEDEVMIIIFRNILADPVETVRWLDAWQPISRKALNPEP